MFENLFAYPNVLARHEAGPAAEERDRYLVHRVSEGLLAPPCGALRPSC